MTFDVVGTIDDIIGDPEEAGHVLRGMIERLDQGIRVDVKMLDGNTGIRMTMKFANEVDRDHFMKGKAGKPAWAQRFTDALKVFFREVTFTEI